MDKELAKLFFPEGMLDYFDIVNYEDLDNKLHFYLEEKNILPEAYKTHPAVSKGFTDEIVLEDFPLRGKEVFLHVKKRRWTLKDTGEIIKRDWNMTARKMRMTKEFADFLKDIH